nr:hypothetical protein [Tanacetum cinerariifolium]
MKIPLLEYFSTVVDPYLGNNKWYQSLVRSFDQEKNNIQVQQNLHLWPYQAQVQKMSHAVLKLKIERLTNELEQAKKETEDLDNKLTGFQSASKDLDNFLESQRSDKNKEGLGYSAVPPPPAQVYSLPKKDMSWTRLPEFADDTLTDYSRPSPTIESNYNDLQNRNSSVTETEESSSTIVSKTVIKFVKAADRLTEIKTNKVETVKKPATKYAEMYRKTSKSSNVDQGKTWAKNNYTHKSRSPRTVFHKADRSSIKTNRPNMNATPRSNVNNARPKTTQDWIIILIQRVKRLERELKARTLPIKIHKVDRGRSRGSKSKKVVDYILQVKIKLLIKKLEDSEAEHQV